MGFEGQDGALINECLLWLLDQLTHRQNTTGVQGGEAGEMEA
jgi:hypothetical protein